MCGPGRGSRQFPPVWAPGHSPLPHGGRWGHQAGCKLWAFMDVLVHAFEAWTSVLQQPSAYRRRSRRGRAPTDPPTRTPLLLPQASVLLSPRGPEPPGRAQLAPRPRLSRSGCAAWTGRRRGARSTTRPSPLAGLPPAGSGPAPGKRRGGGTACLLPDAR